MCEWNLHMPVQEKLKCCVICQNVCWEWEGAKNGQLKKLVYMQKGPRQCQSSKPHCINTLNKPIMKSTNLPSFKPEGLTKSLKNMFMQLDILMWVAHASHNAHIVSFECFQTQETLLDFLK